jgi:hypothetical protein
MQEAEQNPFAPHMALLLQKLTRARWITSSGSTPNRVAVDWTPEGLKKAKRLNALLCELCLLSSQLSGEEQLCLSYLLEASPQGPDDYRVSTD